MIVLQKVKLFLHFIAFACHSVYFKNFRDFYCRMYKLILLSLLFVLVSFTADAQSHADSIAAYRQQYKEDFIKDPRSPLKAKDTGDLRFYPVSKEYQVWAKLQLTPEAKTFDMQTHSGKNQLYKQYAIATFSLKGKKYKLGIYQSLSLLSKEGHKNHLFLPFNDLTNNETTFGGGRYIDFSTEDIKDRMLLIDFNKCYNPYCAFKEGYSCPIPPSENRLKLRIEAGEQLFAGKVSE